MICLDENLKYLYVIINLKSNFLETASLIQSVLFYLRTFLASRYENRIDIFINYNDLIWYIFLSPYLNLYHAIFSSLANEFFPRTIMD